MSKKMLYMQINHANYGNPNWLFLIWKWKPDIPKLNLFLFLLTKYLNIVSHENMGVTFFFLLFDRMVMCKGGEF